MKTAESLPLGNFHASRNCKRFNVIYRMCLKSPNDLHVFTVRNGNISPKIWKNYFNLKNTEQ